MKLISLEQLLQIHVIVIEQTGGSNGLRDLSRLESAIASQTQHVFDQELYEGLTQKAAALIRGIIHDHPFIDGNKRTAMLTGLTFLRINGIQFKGSKGSIENFAVEIALKNLDVKAISDWLETNCQ